MSNTYDVCIRGSGIVGRALALKLAAQRLRVALVAQAPISHSSHSDVRAYALSPASRALLESLRCWPEAVFATPVQRMQVQGDAGDQVVFDASQQGVAALNWIVDVPALESLLEQAVRFQPLITKLDTAAPATLTVVCEGRASSTRAEFGVEFDVTPYDQSGLAARVRGDVAHRQVARQWFADGEIVAMLPLDGADGYGTAMVWSASPARVAALQAMEPEEFCLALGAVSQGALGAITLTSERQSWPLQFAQARQWSGSGPVGSWVLAGDAAHTVHPLTGQGLNLGLADVAALADILAQRAYWRSVGDRRLLRSYERSRKAGYAMLGGSADALQLLFQQRNPTVQALRNLGMRGFERSGFLKQWTADRAMGQRQATPTTATTPGIAIPSSANP